MIKLQPRERVCPASVTLTPLKGRIKYRLQGRIWCDRMKREAPNARTYSKNDHIWLWVFGSKRKLKNFLSKGKPLRLKVDLSDLGYDSCDRII